MFDNKEAHETLKPGTHVEVLTKKQVDGKPLCGTIVSASPTELGTYVVEYHPGIGTGSHSETELKVISESSCRYSTPRPF